ncbi:hypothetical protein [Noviherbaspirillum sp. ST9]|uniref:hypothetical protein n=1 Tax=Noviherbaspirillum sp. ST9 TaxID=3401606 RepID=UPI003B589CDD
MRKATLMASIMLTLASFHAAGTAEAGGAIHHRKDAGEEKERLPIRVAPGDWGNARADEIELLLNSVGDEMLKHFPGRNLPPIVVASSRHGPLVMYQKGPSNEYQVLLAAKDDHWAEYVYEFSHELLHILAGYDLRAPTRLARNQWFEEMLCETASLYMLKHYASLWNELSPRPEWQGYAPEIQRFTNRALSEKHRRLPANLTFDDWFRENGRDLVAKPYMREKNELVAMMFLPLLQQTTDWRAIEYLNRDNREGAPAFYDYLSRWYRETPAPQRWLVSSTFRLFHFGLPSEQAGPMASGTHAAVQSQVLGQDQGPAGKPGR